ncbi:tetratricopeptide repeat protein [Lacibacter luteus]|uniref:Tetratricopeptide repeat protein n=1 Tax=Lacibacter luteus TaxID=2508719 RepID=A0A4Q1CM22_9BACT|nr:tetratricopeptide repeat protein [Lacibacter luteus]
MRNYAALIVLICAFTLFNPHFIEAQTSATNDTSKVAVVGKSYAMIIGISNYKHIRPLSFADSDAGLFKDYLQSRGEASIPDDRMLYLVNDQATSANFWVKGMAWLRQKNLGAGDRLYIYLAGHGDAINQDEYFFLTYDCNPAGDKNNYIVTGSIQLYNLKSRIGELSRKNVEIYLIMDACRTNELPGGQDGQQILSSAISERKAGEVIMLATGAGQESMEDATIGSGHGLFTYYLVDGLSGLADGYEGKDGVITLVELRSYVLDKVPQFALKKYKKKQEPFICCDDNGQKNVAVVDSGFLKKWEMGKNVGNVAMEDGGVNAMMRSARGRGALLADSNIVQIYNDFNQSIKKLKLTGDSSADFFYEKMQRLYPDDVLTVDARQTLAAEFINFAQRKINLYLSGKDAAGIQQIRTQLDDNSRSEEIQAGIQRLEYIAGLDFSKVAAMMAKAITLIDQSDEPLIKSLRGKLLFFKARSLFDEKNKVLDMQEAKSLIYQAYALDSNAAYILHTISSLHLQLKRYDSAVYYSLKAISKAPRWRYPYTTVAYSYLQLKRFEQARAYYEKAIEIDPKNADAYVDFGYYEFQQNKTERALSLYQKALQLDPNNISALNNVGWLMKEKGKYKEAIQYFTSCVQKDSSFVSAYNGLARVYGAMKQYDSARKFYLQSVQYYPDQAYVFDLLGNFFKEINLADSALSYFHRSIKLDPFYMQPYLDLARLHEQGRRVDSASFYFRKIISMNPTSKNAYISMATFYQNARMADSANIYFNKAISVDAGDGSTYNSIGVYYFRKNQFDSAAKYFRSAVQYDPLNSSFFSNLASVYERNKQYDSAFYCLNKALELSPGNAQIYNSIALLHKKQNKLDSALYNYRMSYQYNNENISVLIDMADLFRDMSEPDSSVKMLHQAIALRPEMPDLYNSAGVVYLRYKKYDSAQYYFLKAVALDPAMIRAYNNLGSMFYTQQNYTEALQYYEKALAINPSYENPLLFIGLIHVNTNQYAKAIPYLERLVKANNKAASGYYYLAVSHAATGNDAAVLSNLENALKLKYGDAEEVWSQKEFAKIRNTAAFKTLLGKYFPEHQFK